MGVPGGHHVSLGDQRLDLRLEVGKGGAEAAEELLESLAAAHLAQHGRTVVDEVLGDQLIIAGTSAGVLEEAVDNRLVLLTGHDASPSLSTAERDQDTGVPRTPGVGQRRR